MPDIRYVCLSDLHLGADSSVLTAMKPGSIDIDPSKASSVLRQLVDCLRALIAQNERPEKPRLILNGDILEMALTDTNKAAMVFERFIELLFPPDEEGLFDRHILYIPGNHDHHIWESARETQYIRFVAGLPAGSPLEAPWHTTKMVSPDFVPEHFLTNLLRRYPHLSDAEVQVVYPNYALFSNDGQKVIIFTHGHYVESIYTLMSTLNTMVFPNRQKPKVVWEVEAENFAWIDFFWSTLGRSGDVGRDVGLVYDKLRDKRQVKKLLLNFSTSLVKQWHHWKIIQSIEARGLAWLLDIMLGRTIALERLQPAQVLSADAQQGLHWYLEGPLLEQQRIEYPQGFPADITVLFGHTHKPFQQAMRFVGYPQWLNVYNSGGWVVDQVQPESVYGAAAILLDEQLQATSLRLYNQAASKEDYIVRVEAATSPGEKSNSFHERIKALVQPASEPWKSFSEAAAEAVQLHAQVLQQQINL